MANKSTQYGQPNGNTPHELTVEEQRKGAKASHEKHRQNKSWADILKRLGDLPVKSEKNIKTELLKLSQFSHHQKSLILS